MEVDVASRVIWPQAAMSPEPTADCRWNTGDLALMTDSDGVTVRMLKNAADAAAFRALNEEWIARYFVLEERDTGNSTTLSLPTSTRAERS